MHPNEMILSTVACWMMYVKEKKQKKNPTMEVLPWKYSRYASTEVFYNAEVFSKVDI